MRYFFIILWLFVVVSGKLTKRIERDHDSGKKLKFSNHFGHFNLGKVSTPGSQTLEKNEIDIDYN